MSSEILATTDPCETSHLKLGAGGIEAGSHFGLMTGDTGSDLIDVSVLQDGTRSRPSCCILFSSLIPTLNDHWSSMMFPTRWNTRSNRDS